MSHLVTVFQHGTMSQHEKMSHLETVSQLATESWLVTVSQLATVLRLVTMSQLVTVSWLVRMHRFLEMVHETPGTQLLVTVIGLLKKATRFHATETALVTEIPMILHAASSLKALSMYHWTLKIDSVCRHVEATKIPLPVNQNQSLTSILPSAFCDWIVLPPGRYLLILWFLMWFFPFSFRY